MGRSCGTETLRAMCRKGRSCENSVWDDRVEVVACEERVEGSRREEEKCVKGT